MSQLGVCCPECHNCVSGPKKAVSCGFVSGRRVTGTVVSLHVLRYLLAIIFPPVRHKRISFLNHKAI